MRMWRRLSLRARLSAITVVLLVLALAVSSIAAVMLLRGSLTQQIDRQLRDAAEELPESAMNQWSGDPGGLSNRPTDYFFALWDLEGQESGRSYPTTAGGAQPQIPSLDAVVDLAANEQYATVDSAQGASTRWRIAAFAIHNQPSQDVLGWVVVALPMTSADRTVGAMTRTVVLVGGGVVLLTGILGSMAMERSLRSLRRMDHTARAVATGDLSQRVDVDDPHTETGRLGTTFNIMVSNLELAFAQQEQSEARMRQFVSDASHELRTPLASIRGYGELYRMGAVPADEVATTVGRMENEAARMGELVNDLLALARLNERQGLDLGPVDLGTIARDGVGDLGALDPTRPTELIAPEPVVIDADESKIRQLIMNLIGNTVQHTAPGTAVEVEVRWHNQHTAILKIRDHGHGISAEDGQRIFERFYRPDSARDRSQGGTGLGLAIVATIVTAHGGRVFHEPTPGGGATMVVMLPAQQATPGSSGFGGPVTNGPPAEGG